MSSLDDLLSDVEGVMSLRTNDSSISGSYKLQQPSSLNTESSSQQFFPRPSKLEALKAELKEAVALLEAERSARSDWTLAVEKLKAVVAEINR